MKKINGLVLSALTAAFLVGCGGGGGGSGGSSSSTATPSTATDVTVERGPVYNAIVTDANGQVATQKTGTNIYTFATAPVYPITASGGIIDIDGNGIDEGDVELTTPLTSYSSVITPITDYLSKGTIEERAVKLIKLKEILNITSDDDLLKKVPSELDNNNFLVLSNTLYDLMNDNDTTNDDFLIDYDNSEFKTKFTEFQTLLSTSNLTDKKEIAKLLEEKVVENLGLKILTLNDIINLPTTSTILKIADLSRFVSYEKGESWWYDDTTVSGDKLSFKSYYNKYNSETQQDEWTEDIADSSYVTFTKDATNPYKFSYVDPITKEEGTYTIISTKKLTTYTDLYETKSKIAVTKKGTELDWDRWEWDEPTYWENNTEIKITDINGLEKTYLLQNSVINLDNGEQVILKDDAKVYLEQNSTKSVGTWKKENEQIIVNVDKGTKYLRVVSEDGKYYIEEADLNEVGFIDYETIYTGNNLEDFITDIKAPAPLFTSDYRTIADENQTGLFFSMNKAEAFKATVENNESVTFSLRGTDAKSFNINNNGIVTFKTAPDFETKRYYDFYVVATNKVGKESWQNIQVKINDLEETVTTPIEQTTTSFVSGKKMDFNNAQSYGKFFPDGIYEESGLELNESTGNYESYNCSGLWKDLGNNKIGVTCQDNGTTEVPDGVIDANNNEITFQFSSNNPTSQDKITVSEYSKSEEVTIDSFNYMTIGVIDSMISGKTITLSDGITYTFNVDKTFTTSETGVTPNNWGTSIFLSIHYNNDTVKTLVFTETPALGVIVLENSAANNFSLEVKTITSIH